jgi:predicted MPP superfamily phosphohydrolase
MRRLVKRLVIVLGVLGSAHAYIWWRFVAAPGWPASVTRAATVVIVALAPSLPATIFVARRFTRRRAKPVLWIAYTWFGFAVYLLLAAAVTHVAAAWCAIAPRDLAAIGIAAAAAAVAYGMVHVRRAPSIRRIRVPLARLPPDADGYTIVQLTDVHVGWTLGAEFVDRVVASVNELSPDLVVLTGDLVDGTVDELVEHVAPLARLRARDGVYAVTGNHEYYWNVHAWLDHLQSLGIRYLRNQHVTIRRTLELAGTDDVTGAAMAAGHGEDVAGAVAGRDPDLPLVLLAHHPRTVARASAAGVDLQLSGHTHGGQLLPLGWLVRLFEPRAAGLARIGSTWLYVSEGTGFWGPPMRIGTSCEISAITLASAGRAA